MSDFSSFVDYFGGFSGSNPGYTFSNGVSSLNTSAVDTFISNVGTLPSLTSPSTTSSRFDTSGYGGGAAIGVGLVSALYDATLSPGSVSRVSADDPSQEYFTIYGNPALKFDQADVSKEVAGLLQNLPGVGAGVSASFTGLGTLLTEAKAAGTLEADAVTELNNGSRQLVERVGALDNSAINLIGENLSSRISSLVARNNGDRELSPAETTALNKYVDGLKSRVTGNLTLIRNVAKSMVTGGDDGDPSLTFRSPDAAGGILSKFSESIGTNGTRATDGLASLVRMGIVPQSDTSDGGGADALIAGASVGTFSDAIVEKAKRQGIYSLDRGRVKDAATLIMGQVTRWAADYRGSLDKLSSKVNGGITLEELTAHMNLIADYENLPVVIRGGQLEVKRSAIDSLLRSGNSVQNTQAIALETRSLTAGDVRLRGDDYYKMALKDYPGRYMPVANELASSWRSVQAAGDQKITLPGTDVQMTAEQLRTELASGRRAITVGGREVDLSFLLDTNDVGASKYAAYLDKLEQFGVTAPKTIDVLATAVRSGYLYDTNVLTGEKTMNGSNWLQLLLAAGGILTPIANMIYNERAAKKNREYEARVRAEDREFQERLLKLRLASEETQASIAADSKKAVATGSSRTSVTINSPTQSK